MSDLLLQPAALTRVLISFPFLFFLPGYATLRSLEPRHRRLRISEGLYLSVLLSVLLVSPVGLLLAELGLFSPAAICLLSGAYSGLLLWLLWRRRESLAKLLPSWAAVDRWELALLILVLIAIPLYFRPHEYILGGADAGVYVNIAANLAETGSLTAQDPLVAGLPVGSLQEFFRQHPESSAVTWSRFPAFFIDDPGRGLVIPQFFHLHPMWMALVYSAAGVWGALLLTPLWAILGGVSVCLATSATLGRRAGTLALILLTACGLQIWFARYPTSEPITQFLLYGSIYATVVYVTRPDWPELHGLAAGLGWGALLLVRIDAFFTAAVPLLIVALLVLCRRWQRRHWWFTLPWLMVSLQAALHAILIAYDYTLDTFQSLFRAFHVTPNQLAPLLVSGLLLVSVLIALPRLWQRWAVWVTAKNRLWGGLLAALIILSAAFGYYVRPKLNEALTYTYWYGGHAIQITDHENLVRLGWYLSPLGLALGTLGVAWTVWRKPNWRTALLMGIGVFSSFLYLYNILNNPHQVYAMRRYLPAVVPTFLIGAAVVLDRLWSSSRRWRTGRVLVVLTGLALVIQLLWAGRFLLPQVDNQGLVAQVADLAVALPPDDLILFNDSSTVGWGDTLGTALTYLHGRQVMTVRQEQPDAAVLSEQLAAWTRIGQGVLMVPGNRPAFFDLPNWSLEPAGEFALEYRSLESSYTHFPRQITTHNMNLEFYRVVPATSTAPVTLPYEIDVGTGDFGTLVAGFYGREKAGDLTFRWTAPEARIRLPADALAQASALLLNMAAPRPGVDDTRLDLALDGAHWTSLSVDHGFAVYEVALPPATPAGNPVILTLRTEGWNPRAAGVSEDNRELGVMLDWVEIAGLD